MDLMRRRRLLLLMPHGIDTSPIILQYNKRYNKGNIIDQQGFCITKIYDYVPSSSMQYVTTHGTYSQIMIYKDGEYLDYWSQGNYKLNANSNGLAVTLVTNEIDNSYLYINGTGQILFAGKNSPYYGYTNINDMP